MSIHNEASFQKARRNGQIAAHSRARWAELTEMSKRELAELVCHLAALATNSYDETIYNDELLLGRVRQEIEALKANGIL